MCAVTSQLQSAGQSALPADTPLTLHCICREVKRLNLMYSLNVEQIDCLAEGMELRHALAGLPHVGRINVQQTLPLPGQMPQAGAAPDVSGGGGQEESGGGGGGGMWSTPYQQLINRCVGLANTMLELYACQQDPSLLGYQQTQPAQGAQQRLTAWMKARGELLAQANLKH